MDIDSAERRRPAHERTRASGSCAGQPSPRLFELGGNTIWPPALVRFVVQGAIKVIVDPGALLPVAWMAASAALPLLAILVPRHADTGPADRA